MALNGKLVSKTSVNLGGDLIFEVFRYKLSQLVNICPGFIQSVDLGGGQWGAVGSVILWNYTLGGKKRFAKEVVEAIDEKKRSITFKVVEGGVLEMYTSFKFTFSIDDDSNGQDNAVVTWTIDYEKKSESVPAPHALMDLGVAVTKEIARHYSLVPN